MADEALVRSIGEKFRLIGPELDERRRRMWAAAEADSIGYGGLTVVAMATGLSIPTIRAGIKDLRVSAPQSSRADAEERRRVRRPGGGRKPITETYPDLLERLERLVEPTARGDPMSPLRWTCKSTRVLAAELTAQGCRVSHETVQELLNSNGYSLQSARKTVEGSRHADRDQQFAHINKRVEEFQRRGQPVISVDAKKKELVGNFKNGGREWRPVGEPEKVKVHDFEDKQLGKAAPYGVYDLSKNDGWVSVGTDHDTAEFAVASIREWWGQMGLPSYPHATELLITADGGGSNGSRIRLWKVALQTLADVTGLSISVCHFPPGTSKWNKIEHRMFCHITRNWRGRPLTSLETIVSLIGSTTTRGGLKIRSALDEREYPKGIRVSDIALAAVQLERDSFHGDWNYRISPGP